MHRKIVSEFFPSSDCYEYAGGVEIEVYPSDRTDDAESARINENDSGFEIVAGVLTKYKESQ